LAHPTHARVIYISVSAASFNCNNVPPNTHIPSPQLERKLVACDVSVSKIIDSAGSLHFREHNEVAQVLSGLRVWQEAAIPGGLPGWIMNSAFKRNMKIALLGG
jgi:hypothetical protein